MTRTGDTPDIIDTRGLCLLSIDGGGVRGLSTLYILRTIMNGVNDERVNSQPPKPPVRPCDIFDMIGGTSTGGIIAIMLGQLEMDVDECISAYIKLMRTVFADMLHSARPGISAGNVRPRFDSEVLRAAIATVIESKGRSPEDLFTHGETSGCRVFVCAASKSMHGIRRIANYDPDEEYKIQATISDAAMATSAATGIFEPVSIGELRFGDGTTGANNPVNEVEEAASNIWCNQTGDLKPLVKCFISIGTGNPGKTALEDTVLDSLRKTLFMNSTDSEVTANRFIARWRDLYDTKRYFRFNVDHGLQGVGLGEYNEQGRIEAATQSYLQDQAQFFRVRNCVRNLEQKEVISQTDDPLQEALSSGELSTALQAVTITQPSSKATVVDERSEEEDQYAKHGEGVAPTQTPMHSETIPPAMPLSNMCADMAQLADWVLHQLDDVPNQVLCTAEFSIDLDEFSAFMKHQYPGFRDIGKVLTVTGSSQNAYANSAEKYLESMWGPTGVVLLKCMLQLAHDASGLLSVLLNFKDYDTKLGVYRSSDSYMFKLRGRREDVANIALQFAWIISAFRSPYEHNEGGHVLALSRATARYYGLQDGCHLFKLQPEDLRPIEKDGIASCWNPIFRTLVVAWGFPIPPRPDLCVGIELPIGLMVSLAQLDYSLPFLDSFILKGHTSAAVPIDCCENEEQNCIQWHLVGDDGSELSMGSVLKGVPQRVFSFSIEDLQRLRDEEAAVPCPKTASGSKLGLLFQKAVEDVISQNHRHFLGLYENARIELGTQQPEIEDIESAAPDLRAPPTRVAWNRTVSTGASGSVPGIGGISISTAFQFSEATQGAIDMVNLLEPKVAKACASVGVLYNTSRKTAWMVPEVSIILHLMKVQLGHPDFRNVSLTFPSVELMTAERRKSTVLGFLRDNGVARVLFENFEKVFRQMKQEIIKSRGGLPLNFHSFTRSSSLSGVNFKDVAFGPNWELFQVKVDGIHSGEWPSMIKKNPGRNEEDHILVFFCRDHRDYIVPRTQPEPHQPVPIVNCKTWNPLPRTDYLVMVGSAFQQLSRLYGEDPPKLSAEHYWVLSCEPPFKCSGIGCNRLQKLITKRPTDAELHRGREKAREWTGDEALVFGGKLLKEREGSCT